MSTAVETGGDSSQLGNQLSHEPVLDGALPSEGEQAEFEGMPDSDAARPVVDARATPHGHGLLQACQSLLNIIVIALFIITFTVQPFRIPSESMEPTLLVGDFLLVNKDIGLEVPPRVMAPASTIHRGDLIVFHYPVDSSLHLVKRVIGLPGDRVHLRDGHVFIDGHALSEPYAIYRPSPSDSYRDDFPHLVSADPGVDSRWWIEMHKLVADGELTVPTDSYFVLGDNRNDSEDSRYWGFVPRAAIVGKPFLIYFSLRNLDDTPGELAAGEGAKTPGGPAARLGSLVSFARWDRALRVVN